MDYDAAGFCSGTEDEREAAENHILRMDRMYYGQQSDYGCAFPGGCDDGDDTFTAFVLWVVSEEMERLREYGICMMHRL